MLPFPPVRMPLTLRLKWICVRAPAYYYKVGAAASVTIPAVGSKFTDTLGYSKWNGEDEIVCATGNKLAIIEVVNGLNDSFVSRVTDKLDVVVAGA